MSNIIIGIHGLSNKPDPETLESGWNKAILEGLKKNAGIDKPAVNFHSVYWADVMYDEYDPEPDLYHKAAKGALKTYEDSWLDEVRKTTFEWGGGIIDGMKNISAWIPWPTGFWKKS